MTIAFRWLLLNYYVYCIVSYSGYIESCRICAYTLCSARAHIILILMILIINNINNNINNNNNNNNYGISSGISTMWLFIHCFQIELEFRSVDFCGERKTGEPGEKPLEQEREPTTNSFAHIIIWIIIRTILNHRVQLTQ